jgi:formylglycine-generating enzyme required for sulfatase activity
MSTVKPSIIAFLSSSIRRLIPSLFCVVAQSDAYSTIDLEFITIADPMNAADTTTYGRVDYRYRIGRYEVTLNQYTAFLNAVAADDTYGLYDSSLAIDVTVAGISRSGTPGSYSYSVIGDGNRPVTYVSWFDAARMANWMHNGQPSGPQNASTTEDGAYTLNGAMSGIINRNSGARVYIPSENEWYKAAYYDTLLNAGVGGYWLYPMRSNDTPNNLVGGLPNQANFYTASSAPSGLLSVTQQSTIAPGQTYLTPVGAFTASASAYGTFDQGGNVYEVLDAVSGADRVARGGTWWANNSGYLLQLQSSGRNPIPATLHSSFFGFRLAGSSVPEIVVEHPVGNSIADGVGTLNFDPVTIGVSNTRTVVIRNTGTGSLSITGTTFDGLSSSEFSASPTSAVIAPGQQVLLTVTFAPLGTASGTRSAAIHLVSDDTDESPFDISLEGMAYSPTSDTDGDGLNDAAEFRLSALGFDWQAGQPALVSALFSGANSAGLYTASQVQALHVGAPLISRNPVSGKFKLTIGIRKSTNLIGFSPFPMTVPQIQLNGGGELEFEFDSNDNAAFFIIESR